MKISITKSLTLVLFSTFILIGCGRKDDPYNQDFFSGPNTNGFQLPQEIGEHDWDEFQNFDGPIDLNKPIKLHFPKPLRRPPVPAPPGAGNNPDGDDYIQYPDRNILQAAQVIAAPLKSENGLTAVPIHEAWVRLNTLMNKVDIYDDVVDQMEKRLCKKSGKQSVLLIGLTSSDSYRYIFSRLGQRSLDPKNCLYGYWHLDLEMNKFEAGHIHVGETEEYYQKNILEPFESGKAGIVYVTGLARLIGTGTHSNQETGIEKLFASNIAQGLFKSVAFVDNNEFDHIKSGKSAYVLYAFGDQIRIPDIGTEKVSKMVEAYFSLFYPGLKLDKEHLTYLTDQAAYYNPGMFEPERTMTILDTLITQILGTAEDTSSVEHSFNREELRRAVLTVAQVPKWLLNRNYDLLKNLRQKLEEKVIGIPRVKDALTKIAKVGYVAGRTNLRPAGSALFLGPTGTGKSFIAKKLAKYLGMKLITYDMTQYTSPYTSERIIDLVAKDLQNNPYAVYLFEEIDKADQSVLDKLFFLLDEGIFYDKNQTPIFARGAFILMTTNAAAQVVVDHKDDPNLESIVKLSLHNSRVFRDSFLNRFDAFCIFTPFTEAEFLKLAQVMIKDKIEIRKQIKNWDISVSPDSIKLLALRGQSNRFGARPLEKLTEDIIAVGASDFILAYGDLPEETVISIELIDGDKNIFRFKVGDKFVDYELRVENNDGE